MTPIDDERLQRYFDRDLDDEETEEVKRALEASETDGARLAALDHLRGLLRDAQLQPNLDAHDSAELFQRIQSSLGMSSERSEISLVDAAADGSLTDRAEAPPHLRVVGGGESGHPAPLESGPPYRPETWRIAIPAFAALAAAATLVIWMGGDKETRMDEEIATHVETQVEDTGLTLVEPPHGSEVVEVDFGENAGTVFEVEGEAGEPIAVVWIADDAWDEPREARQ